LRSEDDLTDFTAEIADQVESFMLALREIASGESPDHAISLLLLEVSQLLLAGGRLGAIKDVVPDERFEPDAGHDDDVEGVRTSLANLLEPIDVYAELFDPYGVKPEVPEGLAGPEDPEDPEHRRLSDDLADVAADLTHGLKHYRAGRSVEALWWWQFSYLSNWGLTASAVLRALVSVVAHVRLDSVTDEKTLVEDRILAETVTEALDR
jgi:hypothetical protein